MIKEGWRGDKITTVIVLRDKDDDGEPIKKAMLRIWIEKFKYNISPSMKISIPKKVFNKAINEKKEIGIYYVMDKNYKRINDLKTKISKEIWKGSDGLYWELYFGSGSKAGQLVSGNPILKKRK